jgi:aminodeoxychorismate lyase
MIVFLNGQFVREAEAVVSVFDRGWLYGDGLFETLRVHRGKPLRWTQHWQRLQRGAELMRLAVPFSEEELRRGADELIQRNQMPEAALRLSVTRGPGPRGYSITGCGPANVVMSLHPAPQVNPGQPRRWRLLTSSWRVPADKAMASVKHTSRLLHILAHTEAEAAGADEALLLNHRGDIAEAASSNLFWIEQGGVCTPPLSCGALAGITRAVIMELCLNLGSPCQEKPTPPRVLLEAEGAFLTSSVLGIVEVSHLDGRALALSPLVSELHQAFWNVADAES